MTSRRYESEDELDEALIQRFVDGDLDGRERVRVEALLAADADAFRTAMDFQRQNVLLQALHPRRVDDTLLPPQALGLARGLRHVQLMRSAAGGVLALALLVGAGAAGWEAQRYVRGLHQPTPIVAVFPSTSSSNLVPGSGATTRAAVQPAPAGSEGTVERPAALNAPIAVHPPNLQTVGYQLVDGRADITSYGPVLRFVYEPLDQLGGRLSLTVAAFGADRQHLATSINPQHSSLFWQDGEHLFALSGAIEPGRLLRLADVVTEERGTPAEPAPPSLTMPPPTASGTAPSGETPAVPAPDAPKDT